MTDEHAPAVPPGDADEATVAAVPPGALPATESAAGGTASPTLGEQTVDLRSYAASTTPASRAAVPDDPEIPPTVATDASAATRPAGSPASGAALPAVEDATGEDAGDGPDGSPADGPAGSRAAAQVAPWRRLSSAGALIWVLIALFGFTLVVQLRSNDTDQGLSTMRQEDLVRILSDLEARETRLNSEISSLEESQRQLTSGVQGRQAALEEAERRANELGLLAGTLPGRGPGLVIRVQPGGEPIKASSVLNTVQELRGAGGEAMQIAGANGVAVRVVASTAFVDGDGGAVVVDGRRLTAPYVFTVIGAPQTMETALNIPGGVVASVGNAGGTVIAEQRKAVDVTAVRGATTLQYARPVS